MPFKMFNTAHDEVQRAGEELAQRRTDAGYSQRALAKRLALRSYSSVSLWENGRRLPSLDSALLIESTIGMPVEAWPHLRRLVEAVRGVA